MMDTDLLVDVRVAAQALGMGASSLYRLSKSRRVPFYRVGPRGGSLRFSVFELKEALRQPAEAEKAAR